jgi:hypothetical protein
MNTNKNDLTLKGALKRKMNTSAFALGRIYKDYYVATTNNTATVVYAHSLRELAGVKIKATAIVVKSDGAEGSRLETDSGFIRATGGNITILGTNTSTSGKVSTGTPTLTIVVNTGDQTADVTVTGETAKNFKWQVCIEIEEVQY